MDSVGTTRKQRHRREEEWRELIAAWKASGTSRRAWCVQHAVSYDSMRRWHKRLRNTVTDAGFVEVQRQPQSLEGITMLRVTRQGEVEIRGKLSEELLRCLLRIVWETGHVR
jgi:hypothetical protein